MYIKNVMFCFSKTGIPDQVRFIFFMKTFLVPGKIRINHISFQKRENPSGT